MSIIVRTMQNGIPEWALLEIQGDIAIRDGDNGSMNSMFVGDLSYTKFGQPVLIVGHHIMHGKESKLEKPFALFEKCRAADNILTQTSFNQSASGNKSMYNRSQMETTILMQNKSKQKASYKVKALIFKKILFKSRPKPIIEK